MRLFPKLSGDTKCINFKFMPPSDFVSGLMELPVMAAAERDRKFVTHLDAQRARLRKAEMVRVAGVAPAHDAGL